MGYSTFIRYCHCPIMRHLEGCECLLQLPYVMSGIPLNLDGPTFSVAMDEGSQSSRPAKLQNPTTHPLSTTNLYIRPFHTETRRHGKVDRIGTGVPPTSKYVALRACAVCLVSDISVDLQNSPCSYPLPRYSIPAAAPNLGQSGQCRRTAESLVKSPSRLRLRGDLAGTGWTRLFLSWPRTHWKTCLLDYSGTTVCGSAC